MAETNEFFIKIGADVDDAMKKLNMLSNRLSTLASNTQRSGNQISGSMMDTSKVISAAFSEMGLALTAAGIVGGIIGIGKAALTTAAELERVSVAFKVFTGDAELAKNMLADLKNQALESPMQFLDITRGAQTLLQYGLTAQQVVPITRMLGDVSAGNADYFQRLALAFGQVNAAGRLMAAESRQMINAGFNPLKAISNATGESMASLTQRMHDGQISVKELGDAFVYATSKGGSHYNMAEEQAKTIGGLYNKLSESVTFALADIGQGMVKAFSLPDVVNSTLQFMNDFKTAMQNNEAVGQMMAIIIDRIKIAIKLLVAVLIGAINLWQGLVSIMMKLKEFGQPVVDFFNNLAKAVLNSFTRIKAIGDIVEWLKGKFTKIDNATPLIKPIVDKSKLEGLSDKPSKSAKEPKVAEKVEVIPGMDFQTKEYGNQLKKLKQISEDAVNEINNIGLTGNKKKLADLYDAFQKEKGEYMKYGMDVSDITRLYLVKAAQLQGEIEAERMSALMKIIKPLPGMEGGMLGKALTKEQLQKFSGGIQIALSSAQYFADKIKNSFLDVGDSIRSTVEEFTQVAASSFANMFVSIGEGGGAVESIKGFGAAILGALGDMFIKIGMGIVMASKIMITVQKFLTGMFDPTGAGIVAGLAGGLALMALGGLMKGAASQLTKPSTTSQGSSPSVAQKASGSNYAMGGSAYSAQSVRLSIDLTGSITSTQTGYQINKSLETVLRVTGR